MNKREAKKRATLELVKLARKAARDYMDPLGWWASETGDKIGAAMSQLADELEGRYLPRSRKPKTVPVHPDQMTIEDTL